MPSDVAARSVAVPDASGVSTWLVDLMAIARPRHWSKNIFVLAPLVFAEQSDVRRMMPVALLAFACFCLLSSAVYFFNDAIDAKRDRAHPTKCRRPIASGRVSLAAAWVCAALLGAAAMVLGTLFLNAGFAAVGALYAANNVLYSLWLKDKVIADVMSIAAGFVLRLLAGAVAINVEPTSWLIVCGFNVALLLGFGKRRTEVGLNNAESYRRSLAVYTAAKLDVLLAVSAALAIVTYMLYTISPTTVRLHATENLIYTVPFVIYGVFRFMFKAQEGKGSGPVEILTSDWVFVLNGALWVMAVLLILTLW